MALALYRKYRPATFAEVVGQEHVTEPLSRALESGRINHAYLFSGPRGCGKTSSARILARSLNCELGPTAQPCGVCPSCVSLAPGGPGNIDVTELDAASHGGVDDTRELRDRAFFAPAESRYRVFIVDEAHMITTQGFNALLKIVEEPPEHLVFVFATTEPEKVLPTIRSRTHHYPFRLIPPGTLRSLLERVCADEGVTVAPAVYPLVIRAGGGSARDSLSVLDQLVSGGGEGGVTYERAVALLGVSDVSLIDDVVDGLAAADRASVFEAVDRLVEAGHDPRRFATDLLQRFRDITLLQAVPEAAGKGLVEAADDEIARMLEQAGKLGAATLTRYGEILHAGLIEMRGATAPRLLLELLCARMLLPAAVPSESGLLERLERLERRNAIAGTAPGVDGAEPARAFERPSVREATLAERERAGGGPGAPLSGAEASGADRARGGAQPSPGAAAPASAVASGTTGTGAGAAAGSGAAGSGAAGPAPGASTPRAATPAEPPPAAPAPAAAPTTAAAPPPAASTPAAASSTVATPAAPPPPGAPGGAPPAAPSPGSSTDAGPAAREPAAGADGPTGAPSRPPARPAAEEQAVEDRAGVGATAEAPTPDAAGLDAAAVRRVWPEILSWVKERKKRTAALLVSATVRAVEGDTLVLAIGTAPLARMLSEQSNLDVITEALQAVLGVRWRVRCDHGDGGGSAPARRGGSGPAGRTGDAGPAASRAPASGGAAGAVAADRRPARPAAPPPGAAPSGGDGSAARGGAGAAGGPARSPQEGVRSAAAGGARTPQRRSAAADDGVPLPPEPPDEDVPPEDAFDAGLSRAASRVAAPAVAAPAVVAPAVVDTTADDEEQALAAEAANGPVDGAPSAAQPALGPEAAALELLTAQLGARAIDRR